MNALKLSSYLALFTTIEIFKMNPFMQDAVFKMDTIVYGLLLVLALSLSFLQPFYYKKAYYYLEVQELASYVY